MRVCTRALVFVCLCVYERENAKYTQLKTFKSKCVHQVKIHHKDQLLASFNTSALSGDVNATDISVGGRLDVDMLTVTLNFTKITCADGGSYICSVNDSGVDTNATVTLAIRRECRLFLFFYFFVVVVVCCLLCFVCLFLVFLFCSPPVFM